VDKRVDKQTADELTSGGALFTFTLPLNATVMKN
jgi:hypothetical protein